jgi:hypothetical protein
MFDEAFYHLLPKDNYYAHEITQAIKTDMGTLLFYTRWKGGDQEHMIAFKHFKDSKKCWAKRIG